MEFRFSFVGNGFQIPFPLKKKKYRNGFGIPFQVCGKRIPNSVSLKKKGFEFRFSFTDDFSGRSKHSTGERDDFLRQQSDSSFEDNGGKRIHP